MSGPPQLPLPSPAAAIPAAAYVRMSTEHQQYSTENQLDRIKEYAARRQMALVRVFEDAGKSGLNLRGRDSLRQMIEVVEKGSADFKCILTYDISRWGRFQDADESAYYEYICKRAGIAVHYCAEQFENDGSPISNIIKSVKRSMAGEYSRELSTKVFQGACRLIQLGFKQGGAAGLGLRRMLIDQSGQPKSILAIGEHKSLQTDRVVLALGPDDEVATVRGVYRAFLDEQLSERDIAGRLNARHVRTDLGRPWTRGTVHQLLTNEKYVGHNVYHRTSFKLKRKHVQNPPEMWIRVPAAFPALISAEDFLRVQEIILARARRYTDEEMLERLRQILDQHGRISGLLIDESDDLPSSAAFRHRFGSLVRAYQLIGYNPDTDFSFIEVNRFLRQKHPAIVQEVIAQLATLGVHVERNPANELLVLDRELVVSLVLSRCRRTPAGAPRWLVRFEESHRPDITLVARMDESNQAIKDYYLFPALDQVTLRLRLAECNHALLDTYRFDDLGFFYALAERISLANVA
jgi:DNA invertase Pin-like site-specific DNA recombinase